MIKRTFFAVLAFAAATTAFSQAKDNVHLEETVEYNDDKYRVETNSFWSNWFISVGAGGNVYFGDHDRQADFGKRIAPALDIAVGKWFIPEVGVRLMYSGLSAKGATQTGVHVDGNEMWGAWLKDQKFNFFNIRLDAMFNLSNLIAGYNETRVYNLIPYVGVGAMSVTEEPKETAISGHVGLLNTFRLSSALDLNVDIRGTFTNDDFDGEPGGRSGEGMLSATVGLAYKFKPRGWNRGKTVTRTRTVYNNAELDAMREKLRQMTEENERLEKALAEGNKEAVKNLVKRIGAANLVVFPIGKSTLSNQARANIGILAEVIKQGDSSIIYTITGYADAGTGSKELNERLSKERAEAVYNCFVEEFGVDKAQLKLDYKGGVDNMFYDDPRLSRAVITSGK